MIIILHFNGLLVNVLTARSILGVEHPLFIYFHFIIIAFLIRPLLTFFGAVSLCYPIFVRFLVGSSYFILLYEIKYLAYFEPAQLCVLTQPVTGVIFDFCKKSCNL